MAKIDIDAVLEIVFYDIHEFLLPAVVANVHWLEELFKVLDLLTRRRVFNQNLTILGKVFNVRRSKNKKGIKRCLTAHPPGPKK